MTENEGVASVPVVGLGASAGGLEALQTFFENVPEESGLAFVVVMHLSPEHESHLPEVLARSAPVPVTQVTEDTALEVDHVYVIPPNRNLKTIDSHLRLTPLEENRRDRAPIDHFFQALAASHDGNAVAVLLSGGGSDGSVGLGFVKEAGGLTVVQDPGEAAFPTMPRSAVNAGHVDLVLPVRTIPAEVVRYLRAEPGLALQGEDVSSGDLPQRDKDGFGQLLSLLHNRTGHATRAGWTRWTLT